MNRMKIVLRDRPNKRRISEASPQNVLLSIFLRSFEKPKPVILAVDREDRLG